METTRSSALLSRDRHQAVRLARKTGARRTSLGERIGCHPPLLRSPRTSPNSRPPATHFRSLQFDFRPCAWSVLARDPVVAASNPKKSFFEPTPIRWSVPPSRSTGQAACSSIERATLVFYFLIFIFPIKTSRSPMAFSRHPPSPTKARVNFAPGHGFCHANNRE
jgi:hypothetical protein